MSVAMFFVSSIYNSKITILSHGSFSNAKHIHFIIKSRECSPFSALNLHLPLLPIVKNKANITYLEFTAAILICKNIQKPKFSIAYLSIFLRLVSFLVANLMSIKTRMLISAVQVVEQGAQREGQARASRATTEAQEDANLGNPRASHLVDLR